MKKKILALALATCLSVASLPLSVSATEMEEEPMVEETTEVSDEEVQAATLSDAVLEETSENVASNGMLLVNEQNFPDAEFQRYLTDCFDYDGDGYIDPESVTSIKPQAYAPLVQGTYEIEDMTGIELFQNLKILEAPSTVDMIDVTHNLNLEELCFYGAELDVSKNSKLTKLDCGNITGPLNAGLKSLDVSHNPLLTTLFCCGSELETIDVSKNTKLKNFDISYCSKIKAIDVSNNPELQRLGIAATGIQAVDVSHNTKLTRFECADCKIDTLDLSNNPQLTLVWCRDAVIKKLDLSTAKDAYVDICYNDLETIVFHKDYQGQAVLWFDESSSLLDISKIKGLSFNGKAYHAAYKYLDLDEVKSDIIKGGTMYDWKPEENGTKADIQFYCNDGHYVSEAPAVTVSYRTHVQTYGWQDFMTNGKAAGTSGEAKRLEGININVSGNANLGIKYTTHVQSYGWLPWSANGEMSGTEGEAKRLEAIKIQLTGKDKSQYDVYYRVHAQSYGWLGWAKNGEPAGTVGYAKRLEAIQILIVKKGESINEKSEGISSMRKEAYVAKEGTSSETASVSTPNVAYKTHVQTYGWQGFRYNGQMSGTSGEAKRLEGINVKLTNQPYTGSIAYITHVQTYGWQGDMNNIATWKKDGQMSGTSGEAKRLEAICINLTGEMAKHYDVYYRVHAQTYGWLNWTKNGEPAGTAGLAKRLEGIQIVLVPKNGSAPSNSYQGVTSVTKQAYVTK